MTTEVEQKYALVVVTNVDVGIDDDPTKQEYKKDAVSGYLQNNHTQTVIVAEEDADKMPARVDRWADKHYNYATGKPIGKSILAPLSNMFRRPQLPMRLTTCPTKLYHLTIVNFHWTHKPTNFEEKYKMVRLRDLHPATEEEYKVIMQLLKKPDPAPLEEYLDKNAITLYDKEKPFRSGFMLREVTAAYDWKEWKPMFVALIKHGADINAQYENKTALDVAVDMGNLERVQYLLASGANPNISDGRLDISYKGTPTDTALIRAIKDARPEIVQALIDNKGSGGAADVANTRYSESDAPNALEYARALLETAQNSGPKQDKERAILLQRIVDVLEQKLKAPTAGSLASSSEASFVVFF